VPDFPDSADFHYVPAYYVSKNRLKISGWEIALHYTI
jgi:hypothetical protein